jgi:serine/threonine protein kinase
MIGQTISQYTILEKLGEGGMGVVYKARDTKLDRDVALKFLPAHLAASEQDKARFVQEAKAAAALNHPNVCSIIDIQEHDAPGGEGKQMFIVMEFVDGMTLRQKMESAGGGGQPYQLKQAVEMGIQIADGLATAHEKGIVHRDIKPENIMVRKDGICQIMDFGLAKLRSASSQINRLTKQGSTVGTAGYMSPEQIQGLEADHRSDIFSLGILLFELFTGQLPFKGVHETALAYEIVNVDAPPMSSVNPEIDPVLDAVIIECLEKDPNERTQSARQVSVDLKRYRRESSRQRASRVTAARPAITASQTAWTGKSAEGDRRSGSRLPWIVASALGVALAVLSIVQFRTSQPKSLVTADISSPAGMNFYLYGNMAGPAALSPDGTQLAFVAADSNGIRHLYLRSLADPVARRLSGTAGALHPFWAPDNEKLGFFSEGKLKKMDASGGVPVVICDASFPRGAAWNAAGDIVFALTPNSPLSIVSSAGGVPRDISRFDTLRKENSHRWPSFLPDGEHFLYLARTTVGGTQGEGGFLCLASIDGTMNKVLAPAVSNALYANGHILYVRGTTLVAHAFDQGRMELTGEPKVLAEGVCYDPSINRATFTASSNGILLYQTGTAQLGSQLIFRDRSGKFLESVTPVAEYYYPRLSPDDSRVSVYIWDYESHNADIWIFDIARGLRTRFTFNSAAELGSVWSPDGRTLAFNSNREGPLDLFQKSTSGSGAEDALLKNQKLKYPTDWSRDGRFICYTEYESISAPADISILPLDGDKQPIPFLHTEFDEGNGRFSPDGRWIAYASNESGRFEVYVRAVDGPGGKWQVSISGGDAPCWRKDGLEIYYFSSDNKVMAADVAVKAGSVEVSHVRPLFEVPSIIQAPTTDFIAAGDGKRFLMNVPIERQNQTPLRLVLNWDLLLEKK